MNTKAVEILTGFLVLAVATWFMIFFIGRAGNVEVGKGSYRILASFDSAEGINIGSFVKIGGVKVGVVEAMTLNPKNYKALLTFAINGSIHIANDSIAKISSSGLLGEKYISILPGGDSELLTNDDELRFTESSVDLETLIGKMIYSSGDKKESK